MLAPSAGVRRVGGKPKDFLLTSVIVNTSGSTPVQTSVHADLTIANRQFPRLGTVTLYDGDADAEELTPP
jgi:hypothetical protein